MLDLKLSRHKGRHLKEFIYEQSQKMPKVTIRAKRATARDRRAEERRRKYKGRRDK
jgi:hypothetical protein